MNWLAVFHAVGQNLRRNRFFAAFAVFGVMIAGAIPVFFHALTTGVEAHVLTRMFEHLPETRLKILEKPLDLGLFNIARPDFLSGKRLDDNLIAKLRAEPAVTGLFAEMGLDFPIRVSGSLLGQGMTTDLIANGIDPAVVADELESPELFRYREEGPVPVLISRNLFDLYNQAFAKTAGLPRIKKETILGFRFDLTLGSSGIGGRAKTGRPRTVVCEVVGFSDKAIAIGITVPLDYAVAWNREFTGREAVYRSITVDVHDPLQVERLAGSLETQGYVVETANEGAAREATRGLRALMGVISGLSILIMLLAAGGLMLMQYLLVRLRRRELGLLRACGAGRLEVSMVIALESVAAGFVGGWLGFALAWVCAQGMENWLLSRLGSLPFVPESLFVLSPWLLPWAVGYGTLIHLAGGFASGDRCGANGPGPLPAGVRIERKAG